MRYTFTAYERLKKEQHIDTLFRTGKAFSVIPIRVLWLETPRNDEKYPVRVGFSVPKKKFKRSVDRHRITRLMREAWRLNKHELYTAIPQDKQLHIFFIFNDTTLPNLETVTASIIGAIKQLEKLTITISSPLGGDQEGAL